MLRKLINEVTGSSRKAKGEVLERMGEEIGLLEDWVNSNVASESYKKFIASSSMNHKVSDSLNKSEIAIYRLTDLLDTNGAEEVLSDLILLGKSHLLLELAVANSFGLQLDENDLKNNLHIAQANERMSPNAIKEAIKRIDTLYAAYIK